MNFSFDKIQILYLIQALLYSSLWMVYLKKLDIFNAEKWLHIILVFCVGFFTPFILDLLPNSITYPSFTGDKFHDLIQYFLHVGIVEEFSKIIFFIAILKLTKLIDEPIDYLIYASLLALGFSANENVLYMNYHSAEVLGSRGLICSFAHMFFTSVAIYGFVEGRYRYRKYAFIYFIIFFFLAALHHAVYDWILSFDGFYMMAAFILFYVLTLEIWALMINNCLNNSPHYSKKIVFNDFGLQFFLKMGFLINCIAQALISAFYVEDSPKVIGVFVAGFGMWLIYFFFVSGRLSHFTLVPNKWYTLFPKVLLSVSRQRELPPGQYKKAHLVHIVGSDTNESIISPLIDSSVELVPLAKQKLPINGIVRGIIIDKLFLKHDEVYYLFKSSSNLPHDKFSKDYLLLKAFDGNPNLINDEYPVMAMLAVENNFNANEVADLTRKNFPFIQWIAIKPPGHPQIKGERVTDN